MASTNAPRVLALTSREILLILEKASSERGFHEKQILSRVNVVASGGFHVHRVPSDATTPRYRMPSIHCGDSLV